MKVIQGHRFWYQSKAHLRLLIETIARQVLRIKSWIYEFASNLYRGRRAVPLQTFTTRHSNRKLSIVMTLSTTCQTSTHLQENEICEYGDHAILPRRKRKDKIRRKVIWLGVYRPLWCQCKLLQVRPCSVVQCYVDDALGRSSDHRNVRVFSISISIYFVQICEIKPNKMTVEQDNKVRRIHRYLT